LARISFLRAKPSSSAAAGRKAFAIRFTPNDGLRGWAEAKLARQFFSGEGEIDFNGAQVLLRGWQRTWLGVAQQVKIATR
jgi:hypothetical protein